MKLRTSGWRNGWNKRYFYRYEDGNGGKRVGKGRRMDVFGDKGKVKLSVAIAAGLREVALHLGDKGWTSSAAHMEN